jgi:hypothetical protein
MCTLKTKCFSKFLFNSQLPAFVTYLCVTMPHRATTVTIQLAANTPLSGLQWCRETVTPCHPHPPSSLQSQKPSTMHYTPLWMKNVTNSCLFGQRVDDKCTVKPVKKKSLISGALISECSLLLEKTLGIRWGVLISKDVTNFRKTSVLISQGCMSQASVCTVIPTLN